MNVGFIGLGVMGKPMAGHLVDAGHHVVVFNRSRAKVDELEARAPSAPRARRMSGRRQMSSSPCSPTLRRSRKCCSGPPG